MAISTDTWAYYPTARTTDMGSILEQITARTQAKYTEYKKRGFNGSRTDSSSRFITDGHVLIKKEYILKKRLPALEKKPHERFGHVDNNACDNILQVLQPVNNRRMAIASINMNNNSSGINYAGMFTSDQDRDMHLDIYKLGFLLSVLKKNKYTLHLQNCKDSHLKSAVLLLNDTVVAILMPCRINQDSPTAAAGQPDSSPKKTGWPKLDSLLKSAGMDMESYMRAATFDSVCMGICVNVGCSYTTSGETDMSHGLCETCGTKTVKSGMVIMGVL